MSVDATRSWRFVDLAPEDARLISWVGAGCPPGLEALMARLASSGIPTLNVNQGWWPLVKRLDAKIAALAPGYRVARLGEDLGVLDFAAESCDASDDIELLIGESQSESTHTCEFCADRAGPYRQGDWLITLCVDHARSRGARPARTDQDIAGAIPRRFERPLPSGIVDSRVVDVAGIDNG